MNGKDASIFFFAKNTISLSGNRAAVSQRYLLSQAELRVDARLPLTIVALEQLPVFRTERLTLCVTTANLLQEAGLENGELALISHLELCDIGLALSPSVLLALQRGIRSDAGGLQAGLRSILLLRG